MWPHIVKRWPTSIKSSDLEARFKSLSLTHVLQRVESQPIRGLGRCSLNCGKGQTRILLLYVMACINTWPVRDLTRYKLRTSNGHGDDLLPPQWVCRMMSQQAALPMPPLRQRHSDPLSFDWLKQASQWQAWKPPNNLMHLGRSSAGTISKTATSPHSSLAQLSEGRAEGEGLREMY